MIRSDWFWNADDDEFVAFDGPWCAEPLLPTATYGGGLPRIVKLTTEGRGRP